MSKILRYLAALALCAAPSWSTPLPDSLDVIFSKTYQDPGHNRNWREGMVTGNGIDGVVTSGSPYQESLIFQNMFFSLPSADPRENPSILFSELAPTLDHVFRNDDSWTLNDRKRTYFYSFHPAHQLCLRQTEHSVTHYRRWTNLATAEVGVAWTDERGDWVRTRTALGEKVDITLKAGETF